MAIKSKINRIGVLTSGGDAPGMNAAIRAVVRTAIFNGKEIYGFYQGYEGIVNKNFVPMQSHSVSKIISQGGTILKSSRFPEFKDRLVREKAYKNLRELGIDGLVVIGGDGSFRGADLLYKEYGLPIVGVPGTIDNDIYGTDFTIGFDTAINTAVQAIDKGRDAGFIALNTAIATGAEATLIPEIPTTIESLCEYLQFERRKNKTSGIIIVAEGGDLGSAMDIAAKVKERIPDYETRVTTLGHIQRGGSPTCNDRVLASVLGCEAVKALLEGRTAVMVGQMQNETVFTPFAEACSRHNEINTKWYDISHILSI